MYIFMFSHIKNHSLFKYQHRVYVKLKETTERVADWLWFNNEWRGLKGNFTYSCSLVDLSYGCFPVLAIRRCFIYTCIPCTGCLLVVRPQVKQALDQAGKPITKTIISSVLLQLRTVSSYISAAVLLLNQLASFNFLYALFFRSCG